MAIPGWVQERFVLLTTSSEARAIPGLLVHSMSTVFIQRFLIVSSWRGHAWNGGFFFEVSSDEKVV
jgi:hypothetical protein